MCLAKFRVKSSNGKRLVFNSESQGLECSSAFSFSTNSRTFDIEDQDTMIVTIVIFDVAVELYQARPSQRGAIGRESNMTCSVSTVGPCQLEHRSLAAPKIRARMCKGPRSLALA